MKKLTTILVLLFFALAAESQAFKGNKCTIDCEGHAAGYAWVKHNGVTDVSECSGSKSQSFYEVFVAYVNS
jgi:hypothetical protein